MASLLGILFGMLSLPLVVAFALLFEGVDRKVCARMQGRIGPPITQPFYDLVKLFNKSRVVPSSAAPLTFSAAPPVAAVCAIIGATIVLTNVATQTRVFGDLLLVLYLLAMPSLMKMIGGSASGNPYGAIGFSRMMTMVIAYELPLLLSIIPIVFKAGSTLSISDIINAQNQRGTCFALAHITTALSAVVFLLCIPAAAGVVPFDIPEAKTEIVHGTLVEYSGPYLALIKLAKGVTTFALALLASALFFHTRLPFWPESHMLYEPLIGLVFNLLKALALVIVTVTVPRSVLARLKIGQALRFYWLFPLVLGIFGAIFSSMGV